MSKKVKRLYEGFVPQSYTIDLTPDRDSMQLSGTVVVTGKKAGRPSQRLTFHQHGLKITAATIVRHDKKGDEQFVPSRISHHASFNEVRLHTDTLLYAGQYTVSLTFSGKVQDSMHGVYASSYEVDGQPRKLVATQLESHHAREAFPCIDEPEAKATFDLTLHTPAGEAVLANTPIAAQHEADGVLTTSFETTPVMSTYLLAFIYGDLQYKEATTDSGVVVRAWATKAHPIAALDYALDIATRSIGFFNDYYGVPYPLQKCDHVALPDFSSGAMENWGLITYRERCLLIDPETSPQSSRELVTGVVMHELSHQWFGNLVTMRWWDDLWLNESFANVMEHLGPNSLFPEWHVWNTFTAIEGLSALRRDSIAGVQAIKTEVRHPDEISTLFDPSIVYAKGGRLINMLLHYIGEDAFRTGLKHYFTAHAYGNTTGDDLWAALGTASGKDVGGFMNPWLEKSGFPVVGVSQKDGAITLSQHHFLMDPAKTDDRTWPVPLLSSSTALPQVLDEATITIPFTDKTFVRLNEGAVGHYVVHYQEPAHIAAIAAMVSDQTLGVAERLMLLSDSSMLARAGMQPFAETLRLLEHYHAESDESVWDIIALVISDARRFVDIDQTVEPHIKQTIRTLINAEYERLGWQAIAKEPSQDTKLRATIIGLGVYAEHTAITAHALQLFQEYRNGNEKAVDSELRSIVFGAAVRAKVEGAFEYLLALDEKTINVDLKQEILSALTLVRDTDLSAILLERLKDSAKVRPQDVDHWLVYLLRNRFCRRQSWDWLRANWGWLEETFGSDKSYDYLPRYAASAFSTQELLEEYQAFFGPKQDQPALTRNIVMGIEEIQNRVTWLQRDIASVRAYFEPKQ